MDIQSATILLFSLAFLILLTGIPLGFATTGIAIIFAYFWFGIDALTIVTSRMYGIVTEPSLGAIPMFVFMACLLDKSGLTTDLFNGLRILAGRMRGGVAVQTIIVGFFMAAMSGVIGGETVLLGLLALPQMLRLGYSKNIAIGSVCAGGALGTMIPPSIVLIIYGLVTRTSISDLFTATIVPGILLMLFYITYILIRCYFKPEDGPGLTEEQLKEIKNSDIKPFNLIVLPLGLIFLVLGSIYTGIATINESASLGAVGALIILMFKKKFEYQIIKEAVASTISTCGTVIWAGMGAIAIVGIYNMMGGGAYITSLFQDIEGGSYKIILIMLGVFFILGTFMDWIGIAMLTLPIFIPIVKSLGFDPIWFGVLFSLTVQVAFMSPPMGASAFFLKSVAPKDISLFDIYKSFVPFVIMQLITLAMVMMFPSLALWGQ